MFDYSVQVWVSEGYWDHSPTTGTAAVGTKPTSPREPPQLPPVLQPPLPHICLALTITIRGNTTMVAKTSPARRAAFLRALAASGKRALAAERAKVSRSWVMLHR